MSVPIVPVRSCKLAIVIERDLGRTSVPSPDRGGHYPRHRLTINNGTTVSMFHDERDILSAGVTVWRCENEDI